MEHEGLEALAESIEASARGRRIARPITLHVQTPRNVVLETGDGLIIRAGDARGGSSYAREIGLLEVVRRYSPVPVPSPWLHAAPTDRYSAGIYAHEKIPGRPIPGVGENRKLPDSLCADVARFLSAIHRIPQSELADLSLPTDRISAGTLRRLFANAEGPIRSHAGAGWSSRLARLWPRIEADLSKGLSHEVLLHGDLWHTNLLTDQRFSTLTGVIDWEDAFIGDPAIDFAALISAGESFLNRVVRHYVAATGMNRPHFRRTIKAVIVVRLLNTLGYHVRESGTPEVQRSVADLLRLCEDYDLTGAPYAAQG